MRVRSTYASNPRKSFRRAVALGFALLGLLVIACGGGDRASGLDTGGGSINQGAPCEAGEVAACSITLEQASGILSCYHGTKECLGDRMWGPCENGTVTKQIDPTTRLKTGESGGIKPPSRSTYALSTVKACVNNPCNPDCQYWAENPTDITNDTTTIPGMSSGPLPNWETTTTTCSHQLCAAGTAALDPACHPCVKKVCDQAATAYCCTSAAAGAWDSACVNAVYTQCSAAPPIMPQICGFTMLADSALDIANASTFPSSVGTNGTITMASGTAGKNLIVKNDITLANASTYDIIYSYGKVSTNSGLTVKDVYAVTGVDIANGVTMQNVRTQGSFTSSQTGWTVNGSLTANGSCLLTNSSKIVGTINCGGAFSLDTSGTLTAGTTAYIGGNLSVLGNGTAPISAHVGGTTTFTGSGSKLSGSLYSAGLVTLNNSNTVSGSINGGANLACSSGGNTVTGNSVFAGTDGCTTNVTWGGTKTFSGTPIPPTAPTLPTFPGPPTTLPLVSDYTRNTAAICATAAAQPPLTVPGSSGTRTITPGTYGTTTIGNTGTLILDGGGAYVFNSLDVTNSSTTIRFKGAGPWDITVCGAFALRNSGYMVADATGVQVDGKLVTIYSAATSGTCIKSDSNTKLSGVLIAPQCKIDIGNGTTAQILAWGKDVTMGSGNGYLPITQADCAAIDRTGGTNVGPTMIIPGSACPVTISSATKLDYDPANCESAQSCQVNGRCENVSTDVSCAHRKCVVGAALTTAACRTDDKCVDVICTADSSCCSSASFWTQSCVDKVSTLCSSTCGAISKSACEHDACTTGLALSRSCSNDVKWICDNGYASCCDGTAANSWDATCIGAYTQRVTGAPLSTGPATLASLCDYAIVNGSGALNLDGTVVKGNVLAAAGAINGYGAVSGNTYNNQPVYGNGHSGVQSGYSKVTITSTPYTAPAWSDIDPSNGCAAATSSPTTWSTPQAQGAYGYVTVGSNITLAGAGGPSNTINYYVGQFNVANSKTLTLPTDGTKVNIFVCSSYFQAYDSSQIISPTGDPLQLSVWVKSSNITFGNGSTSWGAFSIATGSGSLTMNGTAKVIGLVHNVSGGLTGAWGTGVDASGVTRAACLSRGVDPKGTPNLCPTGGFSWSPSTVTGTPVCKPNLDSSNVLNQRSVADCSEADLTLDAPCDNKVPVCNRGNKDLAANQAEISFYPKQAMEFATSSPTAFWKDPSVCNVGVAVPKGTCVNVTCPAFTGDMTAYLQMKSSATQTECSNLDNWTYYPANRTCGGAPVTTVTQKTVTEIYQAVCPANSTAIWGFLGWDTDLVGASTVDFSAQLSSDGVSYGTSKSLGTAATATSSQDCPFGSPCAVDVGSTFYPGGETVQPSYLKLTMKLNPDGLNKATLAAWDISYTCRADQ